ncbi:FCD domain-containing protein [Aminobacter carboxidus]|uniref:GntR family transcriptional regulator n=1 Tax=Aminobacter carboxidus TaxID=376165 RepID=A0ABR9GV46_9HYPH|nr:GntR family transcriptional regulator [Aminobacter carboxidus]
MGAVGYLHESPNGYAIVSVRIACKLACEFTSVKEFNAAKLCAMVCRSELRRKKILLMDAPGMTEVDKDWVIQGDDRSLAPHNTPCTRPAWIDTLERALISGADFWETIPAIAKVAVEGRSSQAFADAAYRCLHLGISIGSLGTGMPLIENDIADVMGVSRTPVREALQRLVSDGLLSRRKRGWEVRRLDRDQLRESYEVRMALESFATAQAAIRATDEDIRAIVDANSLRSEIQHGDVLARLTSNRDFHNRIFKASYNARLVSMIRKHTQYYFSYKFAHLISVSESTLFQTEHDYITAAIQSRAPLLAEKHARAHIASTYDVYSRFYSLL